MGTAQDSSAKPLMILAEAPSSSAITRTANSGAGDRPKWAISPSAPGKSVSLTRSEEHTSELQSRLHLVCRLLLEKKKKKIYNIHVEQHLERLCEHCTARSAQE